MQFQILAAVLYCSGWACLWPREPLSLQTALLPFAHCAYRVVLCPGCSGAFCCSLGSGEASPCPPGHCCRVTASSVGAGCSLPSPSLIGPAIFKAGGTRGILSKCSESFQSWWSSSVAIREGELRNPLLGIPKGEQAEVGLLTVSELSLSEFHPMAITFASQLQ